MGIWDRPTAPRSLWPNGHIEGLIGSTGENAWIMSWSCAMGIYAGSLTLSSNKRELSVVVFVGKPVPWSDELLSNCPF
jgi:hypothetical protein